ncbi:LacI family DNA-binding transcriptional regulator [Brachybacterium hainanense]|uniref:LacI family DNA-binding transcriptional regulator n=1 Tax=Brachybacterium hainanense TaxID=1541174 RepID=A0ABV6RFJ1_9MICO
MNRVRLADVAARAGVSTATVSHVLRGGGGGTIRVSETTARAVRHAAQELGYVPSAAARGLAAGSSGRVAIMVPYLYNPYFAHMAQTLILALEERGMTTTLRLAHDAEAERDAVLGRTTGDVDGVIVCPHFLSAEMLDGASPARPVVQVGGSPTEGIDCVVMGEQEGMVAAARHLLARGRRRIAYVADPWIRRGRSERFEGYRRGLAEHGLEVDPALVIEGSDWDRRGSGLDAMVGLLRSGAEIDAAICVNDAVAVGALRALSRAGVRVPGDVALTGFDATEEAAFTSPPLTSVDPGVQGMAELGVEMLVARLAGEAGPARRVSAPPQLVIRASTASA